jgi:hypothetical protein
MATSAIRTQFGFVDIDMAGGALLTLAGECQTLVATDAGCGLVPSLKRETRRTMIERGISAHLPGIGRVAFFAGDLDIAVRRYLGVAVHYGHDHRGKEHEQSLVHFTPRWHDSQRDASGL